MDVIKQSSAPEDSIFYLIDAIGADLSPEQELKEIDKGKLWVVINTHEPASHRWFDRLIAHLINQCDIDPTRILLHSACLDDPDSPIALVSSITDSAFNFINHMGRDLLPGHIKHHFVCLNRQHRWQRRRFVDLLLSRGLDKYGQLSYLESDNPLILDRPILDQTKGEEITDVGHPGIKDAAINIMTETGFESNTGVINHHHSPAITEKTFKSIFLAQFPVWVSSAKTVECYRNLGFDAFDDIIDHRYDLELDPEKRLDQIVDEIERLIKISLPDWQRMRDANLDRFQANLDRLIWYSQNHLHELPQWNWIFN